ncbi:MAG: hypothetical protein WAK82_14220 [Streptosporangiaceae bacterium]
MSRINHSSRSSEIRWRPAAREEGLAGVVSVTTAAALSNVVIACAVAVVLPGRRTQPAHRFRPAGRPSVQEYARQVAVQTD